MKVLFCHDGPLIKDELNNFYGVAHNSEMFKRYFAIGDKLEVLIRVRNLKKEELKKYSKINIPSITIKECPNISSLKGILFKKNKFIKLINQTVLNSDFLVVRLPSIIGLYSIKAAIKYNKPFLIEVVACAWDTLWNYSLKGKLLAPYMYLMTKKYIKKSRNVIYVTSQFLQQRYPTNGNYIGCSDAIIKNQDDFNINKRIDKIANLHKENKIVLGTIGAIDVKYKGQKYIIKALAKLKKEGITNYEYHLVGGGKSDYLIKLSKKYKVSDLIKIIGSVPHEKIFDWLDDIDIYVQPSLTEGLPRSVIEAMSRACPAIGTNVGGIPELLDKDYLFSKKSVKEICKILKTFNVEKMKNQSIINYEKSKLFTEDYLNNKRSKFLKDIITIKQF